MSMSPSDMVYLRFISGLPDLTFRGARVRYQWTFATRRPEFVAPHPTPVSAQKLCAIAHIHGRPATARPTRALCQRIDACPGLWPLWLTNCHSHIPCQVAASPESIVALARSLIATREEKQMYLGGGVVGIVVVVLIVLFLVGRI